MCVAIALDGAVIAAAENPAINGPELLVRVAAADPFASNLSAALFTEPLFVHGRIIADGAEIKSFAFAFAFETEAEPEPTRTGAEKKQFSWEPIPKSRVTNSKMAAAAKSAESFPEIQLR